jgi:hypothetical protein
VTDGHRVFGIYRLSVILASGRYAMIYDGIGFSLVLRKPERLHSARNDLRSEAHLTHK